jgi:ribosomal protein L29
VIAAVQEGTAGAELATRPDLAELRAEFKADLAALRSELHETGLRLEAKIEAVRSAIAAVKADILNRVFGMILGALVVNIIAVVGAMFAVAKLVAH